MRILTTLVLIPLALSGGCSDAPRDPPSSGSVTERDSAGVTIVEIPARALQGLPSWNVGPTPRIAIGAVDGPDHSTFVRIADVALLTDGSIAVADGRTNDIRIFRADGSFVRRIGRAGTGPGEFQGLAAIAGTPGGGVAAYDLVSKRVMLFDSAGKLVRSFPDSRCASGGCARAPVGILEDGSLLATTGPSRRSPRRTSSNILVPSVPEKIGVGIASAETFIIVDSIAQGAIVWVPGESDREFFPFMMLFGGEPVWAVNGKWAAAAHSSRAEISLISTDRRRRSARLHLEPDRVTTEVVNALRKEDLRWYRGDDSLSWRTAIATWLNKSPHAETKPFFSALVLDNSGGFWLREYTVSDITAPAEPRLWTVFDSTSRPIARIHIALDGVIEDISDGTLLVRREDSLGVQRVELFTIAKSPP